MSRVWVVLNGQMPAEVRTGATPPGEAWVLGPDGVGMREMTQYYRAEGGWQTRPAMAQPVVSHTTSGIFVRFETLSADGLLSVINAGTGTVVEIRKVKTGENVVVELAPTGLFQIDLRLAAPWMPLTVSVSGDAISDQRHPDTFVREARARAFIAEADPLAFKLLRGEVDQATYLAKVDEIRARYPYAKGKK